MIVPSAGGTHILPAESLWAFKLSSTEAAISQAVFQMVKDELGGLKKVGIVFEDSTFGHDAAVAAVTEAEARNLVVTAYLPYNSSSEGFSTVVDQLQMALPDILYLVFKDPTQAENLLTALQDSQLEFTMVIARSAGFATSTFLTGEEGGINPLAENLIIPSQWRSDPDNEVVINFEQAFAAYTQEQYGSAYLPTEVNVEAYSSLVMLAHALEKTMNSADVNMQDITSVRSILRQSLQGYKSELTPLGVLDMDAAGQNQSLVFLDQVIEGQFVVIYPPDMADQSPLYSQ